MDLLLEQGADPNKAGMNGATALQIAASMGHLEVMKLLLENGAMADAPHKFAKSTALHFAAEMGQADAIRLLCKHGANPESEKIQGGRPLHVAADSNQTEVAKALVKDCKAELNSLLLGDTTPMYLAASKGFTDVVRVLLKAGGNTEFVMPSTPVGSAMSLPATGHKAIYDTEEEKMAAHFRSMHQKGSDPSQAGFETGNGATALHAAVENGHIDTVKLLLKSGVKQSGSMEGATPLILGAMYNQVKIAPLLIKYGAGLNDRVPSTGNTALYHAVGSGYDRYAKVLLKAKCDLEVKNNLGATALMYACHIGRVNMLELLIQNGAKMTASLKDGSTCLHTAAERSGIAVLNTLLAYNPKLNVDMFAEDKKTPLHVACEHYYLEMVKQLVNRGADISARIESTGATPLMIAARHGRDNIVEFLIDKGADISATGTNLVYQTTALHMAAQYGHIKVIKLLLKHGANVNSRMTIGVSPLFAAAEAGNGEVVEFLLSKGAAVNFRNIHGANAVLAAARGQHLPIIRKLVSAGGRVNVQLKKNLKTALHMAVMEDRSAVAAVLLEKGADPTIKDADGSTPMAIAQKKRNFELVKLLGKYETEFAQKAAPPPTEPEEEEGDEDLPQVVMVSRVKQDGQLYLVDKNTGIV